MKKALFLIVFTALTWPSLGQKFIKYIFYENKIKVLIPKNIEENEEGGYINSDQDLVEKKLLKYWNDKKATILCLESENIDENTLEDNLGLYAGKWEWELQDFKNLTQEVKEVNRETLAIFECTGTNKLNEEIYILSFIFLLDEKVIYFEMFCPQKKMKKYKPLFWDVLKSIEVS